jgi:hypothetical protein
LIALMFGLGLSGPMKSITVMKLGLQEETGKLACATPLVHCSAFAAEAVFP